MNQIFDFIAHASTDLGLLKYLLIFIAAIIEGPMTMVLTGFFSRLGYFNVWLAFPFVLCGDLVGDWFWYSLGRFQARKVVTRFGHFVGLTPDVIVKVEGLFSRYQNRIIFISKMTMGLGFAIATLITAGMLKIKFREFMTFNFLGGLIWVTGLLTVGYTIGHAYLAIGFGFRIMFIISAVVFLFVLSYGFSRFVKSKYLPK